MRELRIIGKPNNATQIWVDTDDKNQIAVQYDVLSLNSIQKKNLFDGGIVIPPHFQALFIKIKSTTE